MWQAIAHFFGWLIGRRKEDRASARDDFKVLGEGWESFATMLRTEIKDLRAEVAGVRGDLNDERRRRRECEQRLGQLEVIAEQTNSRIDAIDQQSPNLTIPENPVK